MSSKIECYKQNMLNFLRDFEPLKHKYYVIPDLHHYPPKIAAEGAKYDAAFQFTSLSKKNFSGILSNLSLVYGNTEVVQKDIETYFKTEKEIISRYLNLPLISSMFDEDYFEFEWDMHVGQNFAEHRNDYYRDHFMHQVRNMYMMHELLEKWFYTPALEALSDKNTGRISEYTYVKFQQFILDKRSPEYTLCAKNASVIRNYLPELPTHIADNIKKFRPRYLPFDKKNELQTEDYAFHYFFKYVIYASAYLSALFHDMGYPICHFLGIRSRISAYNPALYMITQNITGSIDDIFSKLGDSLLFTIVSHDEIKDRMKRKGNGQYDHGLYSALTFLLHFYETDAIQSLSPEKRCAVELAALAIYNHTLSYACAEKPDKAKGLNYYQPVFRQNPVSFLLHFCDDLEEWDRRYFEISDASALSVCSNCHGMLMPYEKPNDYPHTAQYKKEWGEKTTSKDSFKCFCSSDDSGRCFRNQTFFKRQIYLVTTAPKVTFSVDDDSQTLHAEVNYDLFRLLQMSHINNTYAKFRLKDLRELKCRTYNQQYKNQCRDFDFNQIYVDAFMSANPILIKIKLLEKSISQDNQIPIWDFSYNSINQWLSNLRNKTTILKHGLYEYLFSVCTINSTPNYRINFYIDLLNISQSARTNPDVWKDISSKIEYQNFIRTWCTTTDEFYNQILEELVYDCIYQYHNEPNISNPSLDYNNYMSQNDGKTYKCIYEPDGEHSDPMYNAVLKYCDANNSFNKYFEAGNQYVGYFGDLYFFEQLNDLLY